MPIERTIRFETVGNANTISSVFYNNYFADSTPVATTFFEFDNPDYYTYGGTLRYYSQDPYSIFTNLINPPIRFVFTANTHSLTGDSYFKHEIFRLDYNTHKQFSTNQITNSQEIIAGTSKNNNASLSTTNQNPNLNPLNQTTSNRVSESSSRTMMGGNVGPQPDALPGQMLSKNDLGTIQSYFDTPLLTITASTSAITGTIYDLKIDQFIKKLGNYKTELLLDKSQYFIKTSLIFNLDLNRNYDNFSRVDTFVDNTGFTADTIFTQTTFPIAGTALQPLIDAGIIPPNLQVQGIINTPTIITGATTGLTSVVTDGTWNNILTIENTISPPHIISAGTYSGLTVAGNFFTYFLVPDKPVLEYPIMQGSLTTFTPEFRWSNGGNADSFVVQINYNVADTGFTGTVLNYPVEKSEKNRFTANSKTKGPDSEFSTNKDIYTFQSPVKSNKCFIYRIGNSKEVNNVFGVRQNVITFSDYYSACSQTEPVKTYVLSEVDSKYIEEISGFGHPPSLDYEDPVGEFTLSGTVSGSTIVGANMKLVYPNSSFATTTTDSQGRYAFADLEPGVYTLTTTYRGYQQDVRLITISANTVENFRIHLLWGDSYDTWGALAGDIFS